MLFTWQPLPFRLSRRGTMVELFHSYWSHYFSQYGMKKKGTVGFQLMLSTLTIKLNILQKKYSSKSSVFLGNSLLNQKQEMTKSNKKHFSSFLKDFQMPKVVSNLRMHN